MNHQLKIFSIALALGISSTEGFAQHEFNVPDEATKKAIEFCKDLSLSSKRGNAPQKKNLMRFARA